MKQLNSETIQTLTLSDLPSLVYLHYQTLPHEFLTSISKSFLLDFYKNLFSSENSLFLGIFIDFNLKGAIIGLGHDYKPSYKNYLSSIFSFLKNLPRFFSHPNKLNYLYQSFIFKIKEHQETEIFFIAVDKNYQNKGLGKKLILALEKKFKKKYSSLRVDCKAKLPSNHFYKTLGFKIEKTFKLYGENWNRYKKRLDII